MIKDKNPNPKNTTTSDWYFKRKDFYWPILANNPAFIHEGKFLTNTKHRHANLFRIQSRKGIDCEMQSFLRIFSVAHAKPLDCCQTETRRKMDGVDKLPNMFGESLLAKAMVAAYCGSRFSVHTVMSSICSSIRPRKRSTVSLWGSVKSLETHTEDHKMFREWRGWVSLVSILFR